SSLFLIGAMTYCLAAVLGYSIAGKRIPVVFMVAAVASTIVLHAGKDAIREKYWLANTNFSAEISVAQVPGLLAEWVGTGLATIISGEYYSSAIDRASLLQVLLTVQRLAPDHVPFLEGESYTLLPAMLIPRFLDPEKIASQAAMNTLNIRF